MKKQELIHLHGLLAQVEDHYERETGRDVVHEQYTTLGVQPTSIHKSKTEHKEAVFALVRGLTETMESDDDARVTASAD
ncbi:MAG: UPF0058 family protein [Haloarculaceae archaeon]